MVAVHRWRVAALLPAIVLPLSASLAPAGVVHFIIAERPEVAEQGDSFVLPLSDETDIAHARDVMARGPDAAGAPIVFATISEGADGINRNVLAPGEPLWNWHVSAFEGFGDMGIELVDGNPTLVEEDVQGWIVNTRRTEDETVGHIGFWNYTVIAEIDAAVVPLPAALPAALVTLVAIPIFRRWRRAPWRRP